MDSFLNTNNNGIITFNEPLWEQFSCYIGWQFYTDILQGVDIPAGKKLCEKVKRETFEKSSKRIFVAILQETSIYTLGLHSPALQQYTVHGARLSTEESGIEYRSDDISVEHDEKHPQPKFGGNRFMGARDMST